MKDKLLDLIGSLENISQEIRDMADEVGYMVDEMPEFSDKEINDTINFRDDIYEALSKNLTFDSFHSVVQFVRELVEKKNG
jgi:Tfp pilus assembly protein PilO